MQHFLHGQGLTLQLTASPTWKGQWLLRQPLALHERLNRAIALSRAFVYTLGITSRPARGRLKHGYASSSLLLLTLRPLSVALCPRERRDRDLNPS